jgi:adenylylsulfate reductase, subunit B
MPTFVYMTRCDGCGQCVDICPSDIMHIDKTLRRAYNIEPNMCWECYSCVKACPHHAIDVRGYADFAPLGHSVRVHRDEEKGIISWRIKFRNGKKDMDLVAPITTKPWGTGDSKIDRRTRAQQDMRAASYCLTSPSMSAWMTVDLNTLKSNGLKLKEGVYY